MSSGHNLRTYWCKNCGTKNGGAFIEDACVRCGKKGQFTQRKEDVIGRVTPARTPEENAVNPFYGMYHYGVTGGGKIPRHRTI